MGGTLDYVTDVHAYTEGIFDDFNKALLLRLARDPDCGARDFALDYYTYHCGELAGAILAEAVFIGERNCERPVLENAGEVEVLRQLRYAA